VVDAPKSNDTIQRARALGFSLQALTDCARERLEAQPADHILIVEEDLGLREIIGAEVRSALGWPVELCSPEEAKRRSGVAVGAQVFAPAYILGELQPFIPENRPAVAISYSQASEHVAAIGALGKPSAIAVVSVSKSLLRTARGLLAPAIGRKHTYSEILISGKCRGDTGEYDLVFCDSMAFVSTRNKRKIRLSNLHPMVWRRETRNTNLHPMVWRRATRNSNRDHADPLLANSMLFEYLCVAPSGSMARVARLEFEGEF
jgi:hypothetical protein